MESKSDGRVNWYTVEIAYSMTFFSLQIWFCLFLEFGFFIYCEHIYFNISTTI